MPRVSVAGGVIGLILVQLGEKSRGRREELALFFFFFLFCFCFSSFFPPSSGPSKPRNSTMPQVVRTSDGKRLD